VTVGVSELPNEFLGCSVLRAVESFSEGSDTAKLVQRAEKFELDIMALCKALENKASHAYISVGINYAERLGLHEVQPTCQRIPGGMRSTHCGGPVGHWPLTGRGTVFGHLLEMARTRIAHR
jgi:hypothetical protein